ncbi:hypothetical protein [Clostridium gasigenes]|uniref:Uncharacterized protein n=1 Tax=Clostridium gasigenes TaxID=94869 RepID=A0A1H0M7B2_9CLOT|nr:hypothetical protein [Clostridium gasigenes]SDO76392.1 hypothetical protein SAMN04488529_101352 [Clostridium gasigenes]
MNIICKECNKEFEPKQDMLKEKYLGAMITETYFECPNCNKKYLVCINTPKARKLMLDIKNYITLGENIKADKLRKILKIEMDKSNGKST